MYALFYLGHPVVTNPLLKTKTSWKTDDIQLKLQGTSMRVSESQIYIKTSTIEMETNRCTMMYQTT